MEPWHSTRNLELRALQCVVVNGLWALAVQSLFVSVFLRTCIRKGGGRTLDQHSLPELGLAHKEMSEPWRGTVSLPPG